MTSLTGTESPPQQLNTAHKVAADDGERFDREPTLESSKRNISAQDGSSKGSVEAPGAATASTAGLSEPQLTNQL